MKYISNGKEVTKEEFESLVGDKFKWFQNDTVNAVDFSSVSSLFDGDFKSKRQINDHIKGILEENNKPRHKSIADDLLDKISSEINNGTWKGISDEPFKFDNPISEEKIENKDDVINSVNRGEKEIKEPFSVQVTKPTTLNQTQFFNYPTPEETLEQFKGALKELENKNKEGVKETEGKLNYELDWGFIQQMAERMSQNKGKYEPYNWSKPMDVEKLKQSLFRHVIEVMKGNYSDDGREFGHWESIALNAMMINYQLKNNS